MSCSYEKRYQALPTYTYLRSRKSWEQGYRFCPLSFCNFGKHLYCMRHYVVIMKCCIYTGPPGNTAVFQNVPSGFYYLRVTATSGPEEGEVTWKVYVPTTSSVCSVNLINTGLVVNGTSVSTEFRGMGPTSMFSCRLDDRQFHSCEFYCVN